MALLHLEGFEGLAAEFETTGLNPNSAEMLEYLQSTYHGRFSTGNNTWHLRRGFDGRGMAAAGGRDGAGSALWFGRYFDPLATTDEITIGLRIKFPETVKNNAELIRITGITSGGSGEARIRTLATNALEVQYGTGTNVATTANNVYNNNGWHYIEWQTVLDNSTGGSYELRVDGVNVASGTGVRTAQNASAQASGVLLFSPNGLNDTYEEMYMVDDWYIIDQTGTINNDFLGAIKVTHQPLVGVGSDNDFGTFGAAGGRRDTNVSPNPGADDASGISSVNTATNKQLYDVLEYHASNIVGVSVASRFQITDGALPVNCKTHIKSGASADNSSGRKTLDQTKWTGSITSHEADPNTSTAWTKASLDAAEFGVEIG